MTALRMVALDLSLAATGIAWTHDHHGEPGVGCRTIETRRNVAEGIDIKRILNVLEWVAAAVRCQPHLVVVEWQPMVLTGGGPEGGKPKPKGEEALRLAELHGAVKVWLATRRPAIPFLDVKPTYLQMFATGKGRATKREVREAVTATYGRLTHIADDNSADALSLLALAAHAYGQPLVRMTDGKRTRAAASVKWPTLADEAGPVVPAVTA